MNSFGTSPLELMAVDAMLRGLVYLDEFTYSAAFITGTGSALAANGTTTVNIQINSDSDFIAQEYNLIAWTAAGTILTTPDYLITITRSGSGREIMNQSQPVGNMAGNYFATSSSMAGRMPMASLYQGNGTVAIKLENRTAVAANRVDCTLRGFKVFYQTNAAGETGTRSGIFHAL